MGNLAVYGCSRTIQSLGAQGLGPKIFAYVDRKGRPLGGLVMSAIFGLLCFLSAYHDEATIFNWLLSVAGLATIFSWFNIGLSRPIQASFKKTRSFLTRIDFYSINWSLGISLFYDIFMCGFGDSILDSIVPLGSR